MYPQVGGSSCETTNEFLLTCIKCRELDTSLIGATLPNDISGIGATLPNDVSGIDENAFNFELEEIKLER